MDAGLLISSFCRSLSWSALPSDVRDRARDRLLDALSTAAGSVGVKAPPLHASVVAFAPHGGEAGTATLIGSPHATTSERAAFVNGVGVHSILYEDINLRSGDHPGPVVAPAALAVAEEVGATLAELLLAIVIGYEVQLYLGDVCGNATIDRGFRTTSIFGVVASAAAAASLYALGDDAFESTLGLAANAAFGLPQGWSEGTFEPYLEAGAAAAAGITCARLARAGALAARSTFNGRTGYYNAFAGTSEPRSLEIEGPWRILEISCKPYPISGTKMTSVDSALDLQGRGEFSPQDIVSVDAHVPPNAMHAGGPAMPPYANYIMAQDSAPFLIAAALAGKSMLDLDTYFLGYDDPVVAEVAERVRLIPEDGRSLGRIVVTLADGRTLDGEVDQRSQQVPTIPAMTEKLELLGSAIWDRATIDAISAWAIGEDHLAVSELTLALRDVRDPHRFESWRDQG